MMRWRGGNRYIALAPSSMVMLIGAIYIPLFAIVCRRDRGKRHEVQFTVLRLGILFSLPSFPSQGMPLYNTSMYLGP